MLKRCDDALYAAKRGAAIASVCVMAAVRLQTTPPDAGDGVLVEVRWFVGWPACRRAECGAFGQRATVALSQRCIVGRDDGLGEAGEGTLGGVEESSAASQSNGVPTNPVDDLANVLRRRGRGPDELHLVVGWAEREHAVGCRGVEVGVEPEVGAEAAVKP